MNLALHRSITFWSGLLVIGFVCWAWWDSFNSRSWCRWDCFTAGNVVGGMQVDSIYSGSGFISGRSGNSPSLDEPAMATPFILRGTGLPTAPRDSKAALGYRERLEQIMARRTPAAWLVFVPHWLILLAAALPWLGLLFWRARRRAATPKLDAFP